MLILASGDSIHAQYIAIAVLVLLFVWIWKREARIEKENKEKWKVDAERYKREKQEQEKRLQEHYNKCLTPTITKLFQVTDFTKDTDVFQMIYEQVQKAGPRNKEEEVFSLRFVMARVIETCLLVNYSGFLHYDSIKIAEDMIGDSSRDFDWLHRNFRVHWKNPAYPLPQPTSIPGHVRCGTPFLQAKREKERQAASNAHSWKDRTGYILTNEEVGFVRKYYSIYMTPVIHKMFNAAGINDEIGYILSHSSFRIHPYPEKEFEVDFCHYMVKPLIVSMVKQQFDAYRELSVIDVWDIADSILGEKDHDFDWLELNYGIKWKGESLESDDEEELEMPPPY